ncbi:MAG: ABC transporter permease [Actinomycetota bacterium]
MSTMAQLRHQARYDLLTFLRNPATVFFTVGFPLIFLLIFTSIFGNEEFSPGVRLATFYVPGILALAVISATLLNLAITMVTRRERGILKRVRGTPLSPLLFVLAQAVVAVIISLAMTALVVAIGRLLFDVALISEGIGSLVITVLVGATAFSALGLAFTVIIPSESAAPAITNAVILPLYFISDVFIQGDKPDALVFIAKLFPVQHLALALQDSFDPLRTTVPWPWDHWLVMAAWGLFGGIIAVWKFRWTPSR